MKESDIEEMVRTWAERISHDTVHKFFPHKEEMGPADFHTAMIQSLMMATCAMITAPLKKDAPQESVDHAVAELTDAFNRMLKDFTKHRLASFNVPSIN